MSATITVTADDAISLEARVWVREGGGIVQYKVLQPGESAEFAVFDARTIEVREHTKGELE